MYICNTCYQSFDNEAKNNRNYYSLNMYTALEIAKKIISLYKDLDDVITNLKLQKLLYYEQGYHLAYFGEPLFNDNIEAWMYGPVVPVVYNKYKQYDSSPIPPVDSDLQFENDIEAKLFWEVFKLYNRYSASGLVDLTHSETPWQETPTGVGNVISQSKMKDFFKTRLK